MPELYHPSSPQAPVIETSLEHSVFLLTPKIEEKYAEITKDMATTHFDGKQMMIANMILEIINIMILPGCSGCFSDAIESFDRDLNCMIQISRSKFGFESKLQRAKMFGELQGEKGFEKEKNKTIFGGGGV
jgi:hypothetical protein